MDFMDQNENELSEQVLSLCNQVTETQIIESDVACGNHHHSSRDGDDNNDFADLSRVSQLEAEEDEEIGINPLLNNVVLETLFELCDLSDLRRFRLVCKLWLAISLQRWRDKMVVNVVEDSKLLLGGGRHGRTYLSFSESRILYETPSIVEKPFRNFKLSDWQFKEKTCLRRERPVQDDNGELARRERRQRLGLLPPDKRREGPLPPEGKKGPTFVECFENFWTKCGPWMHHLELWYPSIKDKNFWRIMLEKTVNLKSLTVTMYKNGGLIPSVEEEEMRRKIQPNLKSLTLNQGDAPWRLLFRHFPNLENLRWEVFDAVSCRHLMSALEELNLSPGRKGSVGRKLDVSCFGLQICESGGPEEARIVKQFLQLPQLRFCELQLDLNELLDEAVVSKCLEDHGDSLKTVTIDLFRQYHHDPDPDQNLSIIHNPFDFDQLRLSLANVTIACNIIENLHFLRNLPNLGGLCLRQMDIRQVIRATSVSEMEQVSLPKLKEIELNSYSREPELLESEVKLFGKFAPNVEKFYGPLNNESFRVLCETWRDMRKLHIYSPQKLDEQGFTGIVPGNKNKRLPNIVDLKCLQEFWTDCVKLKDNSILNGFFKLEHLQSLSVTMSKLTSNDAFTALCLRYPSIHVKRNEVNSRSVQDIQLNEEMRKKAKFLAKVYGIK